MKILLLGADGQVGSHLRKTLPSIGSVVLTSRSGNEGALRCDLTDLDALGTLLHRERPDIVVNAAAYTAVDQAETDPSLAMAINVDVPRSIGAALAHWNGAVLHYSTDYVFDGRATKPYSEGDATHPLGVYGLSKREGELALAATGVDHLIVRTAWVYSLHGRNFLTTMLRAGSERPELRIVDDQHGTPTSAGLLADATATIASRWMAADMAQRRRLSGIYHLTAQGETTWFGFAQRLFADAIASGRIAKAPTLIPIPTSDYPTPARRPAYSVLATKRIEDTFGLTVPDWTRDLRRSLA